MLNYKGVEVKIVKEDITKLNIEGIVNEANNTLLVDLGGEEDIYSKGGNRILEQCKTISGCPTGEARITIAGNLSSNYIIHTVGPIYKDGKSGEENLLYNAYYNSLKLAKEYNIKNIAFPSISTGINGYPIKDAIGVAIKSLTDFIDKEEFIQEICFILFNDDDYLLYREYLEEKLNS